MDGSDLSTEEGESRSYKNYLQFLDNDGLKGKRIGVWREAMGFHEKVDRIMEDAFEIMKASGAEIIDPVEIPSHKEMGRSGYDLLLYEFKHGINQYLSSRPDVKVRSLQDIIKFNEANRDRSMPYFEQEILLLAQEKGDLDSHDYQEVLDKVLKLSRAEGIDKTLSEHNLDAIVAPTGGPASPSDVINGDHHGGGSSSPAARAGYPNITLPAGYVFGLPVGISMFSTAWKEPELIGMAYAFEQVRGPRRVPLLLPTLDLP
jgi:amidase